MNADRIPDEPAFRRRRHGSVPGLTRSPPEWGGLGLDLTQDVEPSRWSSATRRCRCAPCSAPTTASPWGRCSFGFGTDEQKKLCAWRRGSPQVEGSWPRFAPDRAGRRPPTRQALRHPRPPPRPAPTDKAQTGVIGRSGKQFHHQRADRPTCSSSFARRTAEPQPRGNPGIRRPSWSPADTPGVSVGPKDAKMGQEGAWTAGRQRSTQVRVPAAALRRRRTKPPATAPR